MPYQNLLSPARIGALELRNRIVVTAMGVNFGEDDGQCGDRVVAYHEEQARGGAVADIRSGIYSLGLSLFHIAVGRLPFESSDDREVLRMQVMEALSSPELKSRGLSHHLHYFIEKMMAKDVEARYQSWEELTDDIRGQIEGRAHLDYEAEVRARSGRGSRR